MAVINDIIIIKQVQIYKGVIVKYIKIGITETALINTVEYMQKDFGQKNREKVKNIIGCSFRGCTVTEDK